MVHLSIDNRKDQIRALAFLLPKWKMLKRFSLAVKYPTVKSHQTQFLFQSGFVVDFRILILIGHDGIN